MSIAHPRASVRYVIPSAAALLALAALLAFFLARDESRAEAGQFLHFPGPESGYVVVPDDPALNPTAAITLEAWVYPRSYDHFGTAPFCPTIAGKNFEQAYWFGICSGRLRLIVRDAVTLDGEGVLPLNAWTHVAGTYDGSEMRLYVNAALDATKDIGVGLIGTSPDPLRIGNDPAWDASPDGFLDEVRLWSAARSDMQIATTMNTTITTATPDLIAAWNFDGDTMPSVTDPVGGHNGTIAGDAGIASSVPTPTPSPSNTPSPSPTETPIPTPTPTPSPSPTASPTPSPTPVAKGDVDCSGEVTAVDALQILRFVAGLPVSLPEGCEPIGP